MSKLLQIKGDAIRLLQCQEHQLGPMNRRWVPFQLKTFQGAPLIEHALPHLPSVFLAQ